MYGFRGRPAISLHPSARIPGFPRTTAAVYVSGAAPSRSAISGKRTFARACAHVCPRGGAVIPQFLATLLERPGFPRTKPMPRARRRACGQACLLARAHVCPQGERGGACEGEPSAKRGPSHTVLPAKVSWTETVWASVAVPPCISSMASLSDAMAAFIGIAML
jgi:hypothetical protein